MRPHSGASVHHFAVAIYRLAQRLCPISHGTGLRQELATSDIVDLVRGVHSIP